MSSKNGDKYVNWRVFTWVISMIVVALGGIFSLILVLKGDMAFVKNEIGHINKSMERIETKLTAGVGMVVPEDVDFKDMVFADEITVYDSEFTPPTTAP